MSKVACSDQSVTTLSFSIRASCEVVSSYWSVCAARWDKLKKKKKSGGGTPMLILLTLFYASLPRMVPLACRYRLCEAMTVDGVRKTWADCWEKCKL